MARRYSGDAEVRVGWDPRRREYRGSIRDPYRRVRAVVPGQSQRDPTSPEAYDEAATRLLEDADRRSGGRLKVERRRGRVVVRRVFQAPCPLEDSTMIPHREPSKR